MCYHGNLKWSSRLTLAVSALSSSGRPALAAFWPPLCLPWSVQEFASTSGAHCQPAWHHQIYFYSLHIEPLLSLYGRIPRLRGAWLHSRTSTGANLCPDSRHILTPLLSGVTGVALICTVEQKSGRIWGDNLSHRNSLGQHCFICVHFYLKKKKDIKYK